MKNSELEEACLAFIEVVEILIFNFSKRLIIGLPTTPAPEYERAPPNQNQVGHVLRPQYFTASFDFVLNLGFSLGFCFLAVAVLGRTSFISFTKFPAPAYLSTRNST
jgi:hypothetical protein